MCFCRARHCLTHSKTHSRNPASIRLQIEGPTTVAHTSKKPDYTAKHFNAHPQTIGEETWMPTAFVLINTEIGSEADVLKDLKKVEGVDEAFAVYGVYDIIARVKADTMDKLKEIVTWRVRRLDKVRSTLTMIVVEETK
jgi:DNA-binding Lrp family transcriptional regulator